MQCTTMLPKNKTGRVSRGISLPQKEINSYSSIQKDAAVDLRGIQMRSLGYELNAKKIWMDL